MSEISVVVPIYNGEKFIPTLIDTLCNQTYKSFEVLLVEDHSSDNSKELIKEICSKDNRFILLEPNDKRGTAVRGQEYALPFCHGKYHFFMSHDDFLDSDLFEKCIDKLENYGADVVIPNCILFDGVTNKKLGIYPENNDYTVTLDSKSAFELSLDWRIHGFTMESMKLFNKVGLKAEYYNSEEYYKRILYLKAERIMFANSNFYYRQNNPDAITKGRKAIQVDILTTDFLLYKVMAKEGFSLEICKERLKYIMNEYFKWYLRGIRYGLWYKNNFYLLRSLFDLFIPIIKENLKLKGREK